MQNNNMKFPLNDTNSNFSYSNQFQKQAQMFTPNNPNFSNMANQIPQANFDNNSYFSTPRGNLGGSFGGMQRGRGRGNSRGFSGNNFRGRGGNRNFNNNRVPNPEFNSINENNDVNDQLDDDYNMSIYDKPVSSDLFPGQNFRTQNFTMYDSKSFDDNKEKSLYDK
jgi:hypothetical protein